MNAPCAQWIRSRSVCFCKTILFAGCILAAAQSTAHAQGKAVNWRGGGTGTTRPEGGVDVDEFRGQSTRVGRYTAEGFHVLNPVDFTFVGQATWTAADGAQLFAEYAGQIFPSGDPDFPFGFVAELRAVGGTGRLRGARGQAVMTGGFTGVPGEFVFEFEGTLRTKRK